MSRLSSVANVKITLMLVGVRLVGKSTLINTFFGRGFAESGVPKYEYLGDGFTINNLSIDGKVVDIRLWKIGEPVALSHYGEYVFTNTNGFVFVYDITKSASFDFVKNWITQVLEFPEKKIKILVGNKADLVHEREVEYSHAKEFANSKDMVFFETSAKSNTMVFESLIECARQVVIPPEKRTKQVEVSFPTSFAVDKALENLQNNTSTSITGFHITGSKSHHITSSKDYHITTELGLKQTPTLLSIVVPPAGGLPLKIIEFFRSFTSLTKLHLNNLMMSNFEPIFTALATNCTLLELQMNDNPNFQQNGATQLAKLYLSKSRLLVSLSLANNNINQDGIIIILQSLEKYSTLMVLDMRGNLISKEKDVKNCLKKVVASNPLLGPALCYDKRSDLSELGNKNRELSEKVVYLFKQISAHAFSVENLQRATLYEWLSCLSTDPFRNSTVEESLHKQIIVKYENLIWKGKQELKWKNCVEAYSAFYQASQLKCDDQSTQGMSRAQEEFKKFVQELEYVKNQLKNEKIQREKEQEELKNKIKEVEVESENKLNEERVEREVERVEWKLKNKKAQETDRLVFVSKIKELEEIQQEYEKKLKEERAEREAERVEWKIFQENAKHNEEEKVKLQKTLDETQRNLEKHKKQIKETQQKSQVRFKLLENYKISLSKKNQELESLREKHVSLHEQDRAHFSLLEQKNQDLLLEKERIEDQYQALQLRINALEEGRSVKIRQQEAEGLEQLRQHLLQAQLDQANKEKEALSKQALFEKAERELKQAARIVSERAELLEVQLQIFKQHGLPPEEKAFSHLLSSAKHLFREKPVQPPSCLISYAWEDEKTPEGHEANTRMQTWLSRLQRDLQRLNVEVFLDINTLHGNIKDEMRSNISKSDFFLIIGTPRYKKRLEDGIPHAIKECISLKKFEKVVEYLKKLDSENPFDPDYALYNPTTNVAFEFIHIWAKTFQNSDSLIPLLFSGSNRESFSSGIMENLVHDARDQTGYHHLLAGLSKPIGIIPILFQVHKKNRDLCGKRYTEILASFETKLAELKLAMIVAKKEANVELPLTLLL